MEEKHIKELPLNKVILFLDLASNSLQYIEESPIKEIFIIDHHKVSKNIPEKVNIINPELINQEKISASGLTYLFCKELAPSVKDSAKLAILGMIGDRLEKNIDKLNNGILSDSEIVKKRGLLIYPSTRPLNRSLEYSSNPYIPEVTGNTEGVLNLLREINIKPENGKYKSILELNEKEMSDLVTAIMLRKPKVNNQDIIGDIFLVKFFNKLEDARELSAIINACSRLGEPETALQLCLEVSKVKKKAETLRTKYKNLIISALEFARNVEKINGSGYVIINAKSEIKDTIAGTITSILSNSSLYNEGTILTIMAYSGNKIKVSSRNVGETGRNLREILGRVVEKIGGEVGGHEFAAGCLISKDLEEQFIQELKSNLEIETIKV